VAKLTLLQPEPHLEALNALPIEQKAKPVDTLVEEAIINCDAKISLRMSIPIVEKVCRELVRTPCNPFRATTRLTMSHLDCYSSN